MTEHPENCAQTLHGYARGHHLLARGGDIHESELHEIDRLSDLSGYLPADAQFDAYHTGFPCGRYYALACTWPDKNAPRRGTVLTHTLLIPRAQWCEDADAFRWLAAHRRPIDSGELLPYQAAVQEPQTLASNSDPKLEIREEELRALLWLWFAQSARPLLWVEDPPPLRVVRALWPYLWTEARRSFAFCTFALQARSQQGRVFDFLGTPPVAVGAFHKFGASPAWWLHERLRRPLSQGAWLDDLLVRGPEAVTSVIKNLREEGLGPPGNAGLFRAAQRYLELDEGARVRLPAARARLDMLARVWPDLGEKHPAVIDAIERLLKHQKAAPLEPKPLWDLRYLLSQAFVQEHLSKGGQVHDKLVACVEQEVVVRMQMAGAAIYPEFGELYRQAPEPAQLAIIAGMITSFSNASVEELKGCESLLDLALQMQDERLESALFRSLPLDLLLEWLARQAANKSVFSTAWRERIVLHAFDRMAPKLAFAAWPENPRQGLIAAASVVDRHPNTRPEFEALLRSQEPSEQLEWCLACTNSSLYELAVGVGAELVQATKPDVMELAARCDQRPLGPAIFVKVCAWALDSELKAVFEEFPSLARGLVRHSLGTESTYSSPSAAALRLIPAGILWEHTLLDELSVRVPLPSIVGALGKRLLSDVVAGELVPSEAAEWLEQSHMAAWISQAHDWELEVSMRQGSAQEGLRRMCQTVMSLQRPTPGAVRPLLVLLQRSTRDTLSRDLEPLLDVLARLDPGEPVGVLVRAELLGALRYTRFTGAWRLVERCFYPAYCAAGTDRSAFERITWWRLYSPDRQRYWRNWLVETWVSEDWPRDAFVRCLNGDHKLARRVFKRAKKKSSTTRHWLESLGRELREDAVLYREWKDVV